MKGELYLKNLSEILLEIGRSLSLLLRLRIRLWGDSPRETASIPGQVQSRGHSSEGIHQSLPSQVQSRKQGPADRYIAGLAYIQAPIKESSASTETSIVEAKQIKQ